jgi:hypothetical protein
VDEHVSSNGTQHRSHGLPCQYCFISKRFVIGNYVKEPIRFRKETRVLDVGATGFPASTVSIPNCLLLQQEKEL